jgi:hypothetical protein
MVQFSDPNIVNMYILSRIAIILTLIEYIATIILIPFLILGIRALRKYINKA